MNEEQNEKFFDLLTKKAVYGLDNDEQRQLEDFDVNDEEMDSLEMIAAAITLSHVMDEGPMPAHLEARILADAEPFVAGSLENAAWSPPEKYAPSEEGSDTSFFGWFGWVAAFAACVALAANVYLTRFTVAPEIAENKPPVIATPRVLTAAETRNELLSTTVNMTRASWAAGNVEDIKNITGDVIWSDDKQTGYMRFSGLPVNDRSTTCYQLWIFDKTQDKAKPIDGGIFDVTQDGEIIIPIDAKLKAEQPYMFAVTIERHGGVVVSDREKIAALATVEIPKTQKS